MPEHSNDQLTAIESRITDLNQLTDVCSEDDHQFLDNLFGKIPELNGPELSLPFKWDGKYRLIRYLGGGMSDVYLAEQISLSGRQVVVKILPFQAKTDPTKLKLFKQESETLAQAKTASIVFPIDYAVCDGHPYLVMEHVPGMTLTQRMSESQLTVADVGHIIGNAASSLHAAHSAKIIHGDIKPANMILQDDGGVKLIDFGLSGFFKEPERSRFGGTLPYAAPEQLAGEEVDARTDLYCLGVVLRNLLKVAQGTADPAANRKQTFQAEKLTKLADQLTAFSKEQRPASAQIVAAQLERITRSTRRGNRWPIISVVLSIALLAAWAVSWAFWDQTDSQQPFRQQSKLANEHTSASRPHETATPHAPLENSQSSVGDPAGQPIPIAPGTVISVSPSGKFIVASDTKSDHHQIIELKAGKVIGSFDALNGYGIDWNTDETIIMVAGRNRLLLHLTVVTGNGKLLQRWSTAFSPYVEMSPSGDRILLHGGPLRMTDLTGQTIKSFVAPEQSFRGWGNRDHASAWSNDGTKFAFYDETASTVLVYSKDGGQPLKTIKVHRPGYARFRWLRSGDEFTSLHHIYDLEGKSRQLSIADGDDRTFNPDETQWVTSDGTVGLATGRTLSLESSFKDNFMFWNEPAVITSVNPACPGQFREYTPSGKLIREVTPEATLEIENLHQNPKIK